ncbi:MAG: sialidase family protein [Bacteroidaceae bacterium]|nr:sialidase family protein [Bacteroidaceae bacterium]
MINKFTLMAAFAALSSMPILAQTQSSEVSHKETILYNSSNTKTAPYRIPAIVTMSNGEILAISDYRPGGNDVGNGGEVDIYARISNDNGATWSGDDNTPHDNTSNIIKVADGTSSLAYGDAAVAAHPETGKVMVLCVGGNNTKFASATTSTKNYYTYMFSSSDYGRTWSSANITSTFKGSTSLLKNKKVCSMFFASGRLLVSKHTPGRVYGAILTREYNSGYSNYNYVFYTDDFGQSWSMLGSDYAISGADEAKLEELPNGDILISSRTSGGRNFNIYSTSTQSWGTQQKVDFTEGNATNGELMIYRGVYKVGETTGATYDIMLQSLPTASNRAKVSVFYRPVENKQYSVSEIASKWVKGIEVYDGNSAYSAMTIMPNGEIGFLYEKDYYSSNSGDNPNSSCAKGGTANIVFLPLTVEEITDGAYTTTPPSTEPETPDTPDTPDLTTYEVTTVTGKIGNATYNMATFSAPVATVLPSGVRAYYVKSANNETVYLARISSGKSIPAGEGVILTSPSTTFDMVEATDESDVAVCTGNLLVPTDAANPMVPAGAYVLALKGSGDLKGQFAFSLLSNYFEYKPNRAYLQLEAGASLVRMFFGGNETSVDDVLESIQDDAIYYDLTGRRVANPVSGSVYIQNGKKVVK